MRNFIGQWARLGALALCFSVTAAITAPRAENGFDLDGPSSSAVPSQAVANTSDQPPIEYASQAQERRATRGRRAAAPAAPGAYFIEFRSRYAQSYGHSYAAFGRLNSRGQIISSEVAGLHPAGDSPVPWMIGHLIPVPSETGPSDGDLEDMYISNRWRVTMGEADYMKLVAKIRQMQRSTPLWSATTYNCNSFLGDIARYMGLRSGGSILQTPPNYVATMKRANGNRSSIPPGSI
ncbi:hypothetical protein [Enterovirga rhinocerotis]|uniref:Permuted papain-like amidase YaeF/Yiix C92 family enzyme n=1 Tax=Enterovirga rhinocerotis TaxID=1339210 RepID=A0A4R7BZF2_9HYPH|nr:hypothetical protein [Enterovirga rhinocerotis]TDR90145.1 hypothetical protein EV668_2987 [Enterovirga rhinocerotis]